MVSAKRLYRDLRKKYGELDFKTICRDEHIQIMKEDLGDESNGLYMRSDTGRLIILNKNISYYSRRDWGWHELYHHFRSVRIDNRWIVIRDESNATLFAALVRIPSLHPDDTIETIVDRCSVSPILARVRIEDELKTIAA